MRLSALHWLLSRRVIKSGMFDEEWYRLAHPYVVRANVDPLLHFLKHGRAHRLSPSRAFDAARYLDEHEEARKSRLNPLVHYLRHGRTQGLTIYSSPPSEADRIAGSNLFDGAWYLQQYRDVAAAGYPPFQHFMIYGMLEGRLPGPGFDPEWYTLHYPDIVGMNPLVHYVDHGRGEGRIPIRPTRVATSSAAFEQLDAKHSGNNSFDGNDRPQCSEGSYSRVMRALRTITAGINKSPRVLIFLPSSMYRDSDISAYNAARAAREHGAESALMILCDHDRQESQNLLSADIGYISLSRIDPDLTQSQRVELVDHLVRSLKPDAVLNVHNHILWEAVKRYGKCLSKITRLYALINEQTDKQSAIHLRNSLPILSGVYFDDYAYIRATIAEWNIPIELQSRLVSLYQPAPLIARRSPRLNVNRPLTVLWSGRVMPEKNIDLLIQIAESAPQFQFHLWGSGSRALEGRLKDLSHRCSHVHYRGPFERLEALPLSEYDALLYTSLSDGLPNEVLAAANAGLPIVASQVGGVGELVDADTGWPIDDIGDPVPYVKALQAIAKDPKRGSAQVAAMRKRLRKNYNWKCYRAILTNEPEDTKGFLHNLAEDYRETSQTRVGSGKLFGLDN